MARLSDVAAIQAMPSRRGDGGKFGMKVTVDKPTGTCSDGPCAGDEKLSTAVKYLKKGC